MLADHGHPQVRTVAAAVLLRPSETKMAGGVCTPTRLAEQRFPFGSRQAIVVPVRPAVLATMIEEAFIVILRLQRLDLKLDETVQFGQISDEIGGQRKIHITHP